MCFFGSITQVNVLLWTNYTGKYASLDQLHTGKYSSLDQLHIGKYASLDQLHTSKCASLDQLQVNMVIWINYTGKCAI